MAHAVAGRTLWGGAAAVFLVVLALGISLGDDIGVTWDEPAYLDAAERAREWGRSLFDAAAWRDGATPLSRERLHEGFPYARRGPVLHPPGGAYLPILCQEWSGGALGPLGGYRLGVTLHLAGAAALLFLFLATRFGVAAACAGAFALCAIPHVLGLALIFGTDIPALFLWGAAAMAFWNGLERHAWRPGFAACVACGFLVKPSAVLVLLPAGAWLLAEWVRARRARLEPAPGSAWGRAALLFLAAAPLAWAAVEMAAFTRAAGARGESAVALDLLAHGGGSPAYFPFLLVFPAALGLARAIALRNGCLERHVARGGAGFETLLALLTWTPAVTYLLAPCWWRDTLPRLAHNLALQLDRGSFLGEIDIFYLGERFRYSLPWHNGFLLCAVGIPVGVLVLACVALLGVLRSARGGRALCLFLAVNALTPPLVRMLDVPAHDGLRLMLPVCFFIAALAGIEFGFLWSAHGRAKWILRTAALCLLGSAAFAPLALHPYHLSYYNFLVGGLRGAQRLGFETTYWYDAVHRGAISRINDALPSGSALVHTQPVPTWRLWQKWGVLDPSLRIDLPAEPDATWWGLYMDSCRSRPETRLLAAMKPHVVIAAHDGVTLYAIYSTRAMGLATALARLAGARGGAPEPGMRRLTPPEVDESVFALASEAPDRLRDLALHDPTRLACLETDLRWFLAAHPTLIAEATELFIRRPDEIRRRLLYPGYLPRLGLYLDQPLTP